MKWLYFFTLLLFGVGIKAQNALKYVVYDFDGFDIGATDLPDGDYKNSDLAYQVSANPLQYSEVLGDRVLQLDLHWSAGSGEFGKELGRFIELNPAADHINFYLYNPTANPQDGAVEITLSEDDNADDVFEFSSDDVWAANFSVPRAESWQLISVPLNAFNDANPGGNGIFDAAFTNAAGKVFALGITFRQTNATAYYAQYFIDMLAFSEGPLPTGSSPLSLPAPQAVYPCLLGALSDLSGTHPDQVPNQIEGLFNYTKKIRFVNWFMEYSHCGTVADNYPGAEVQNLLNSGYRPVITWESMFACYSRLDPVQPRLNQILSGAFDAYYDQFADIVKGYNDTVIIRILHEFEGNWYPWSLSENGQNAQLYKQAFRYIVDRFRARGASKVQWMWCVNAEPKPYSAYNWIVSAYPGDEYVNMVATDIYNHPDLGTPPWRSFRYTYTESYYYLSKYFPNKPLYICEVACRERDSGEPGASQTKAEWTCQMSRDLQTYFYKTKALIFFSVIKEHDWRLNSSAPALQAANDCIWQGNFFGDSTLIKDPEELASFVAYPNPFMSELSIAPQNKTLTGDYRVKVYTVTGQEVLAYNDIPGKEEVKLGYGLAAGVYFVELTSGTFSKKFKVIKALEK